MKPGKIATLAVLLASLIAVLAGCGGQPRDLVGTTPPIDRAPAQTLDVMNAVDLCGRVTFAPCESEPGSLPDVKVTATWNGGPTLSTTTDGNGGYCFPGIPATGLAVTVCVDPATLPPGAVLTSTPYPNSSPYCQTVPLNYPNSVSDANFNYEGGCEPPPPPCSIPGSIDSGFNGTAVVGTNSGPAYIWFNSNLSLKNTPAGRHVMLTNSRVIINGVPHPVPDATITFANVGCASTTYDGTTNTWNTTVPVAGSDAIFLSGLALPVTNLPGGAKVRWEGTFATDQPGICISWKWGAAAYKSWPLAGTDPDYNAANSSKNRVSSSSSVAFG
ncbi:MAG: hypothetical protein E6K81_13215 [Candidatus Eisenbacteria bacterium]|uniref:Carboxypeptidase regulatory-like domain-containing protein n=1 Tax=Eiseniibacteriota bacterium TaxID=2212470 RepID=A0A538U2S6_UNCEI|nr:MAG: hypothetical protein E6K81_13215 [Candidatus Eisenbacteria bacterium]